MRVSSILLFVTITASSVLAQEEVQWTEGTIRNAGSEGLYLRSEPSKSGTPRAEMYSGCWIRIKPDQATGSAKYCPVRMVGWVLAKNEDAENVELSYYDTYEVRTDRLSVYSASDSKTVKAKLYKGAEVDKLDTKAERNGTW